MTAARDLAEARGKPLCGAKNRKGGACGRPAGWGTDHVGIGKCKLHGGNTPNHRRSAARIVGERLIETYGSPVDTTPAQALLEEVSRTAGHVAWLRVKVAQLADDELVKAPSSAWLDLYQRERRHYVDAAARAITAGASERLVALAETLAEPLGQVMQRLLELAGVADHPDAAGWVRQAFLELEAGGGAGET